MHLQMHLTISAFVVLRDTNWFSLNSQSNSINAITCLEKNLGISSLPIDEIT